MAGREPVGDGAQARTVREIEGDMAQAAPMLARIEASLRRLARVSCSST